MGNLEKLLGDLSNTTSTFNVELTAEENAKKKAEQAERDLENGGTKNEDFKK